jgi:anti-sigma regulatory factor (Ser/Thr protein kinase)
MSGPVTSRLWIGGCGPGLGGQSKVAHWSRQVGLPAATSSTGRAREFVGLHLKGHELSGLVDDVQLVVSELATNAVLHAGTAFTVSLWCDGASVLLTVTDDSPLLPRCGEPSEVAIGGRGLTVVQASSHDWGVTEGALGKAAWALFHTTQRLDQRSSQRMDPVPEGDPHGVETVPLRG